MTASARLPELPRRTPRVDITYDLMPGSARREVRLPFVVGVLADLSGNPADRLPPVNARAFVQIDAHNFDARLRACRPRVAFQAPNALTGEGGIIVDITFESMDDFAPARVADRVDALRALSETRSQLAFLTSQLTGNERSQVLLRDVFGDPELVRELERHGEESAGWLARIDYRGMRLESAIQQAFRPVSDEAMHAIERAILLLARAGWRFDAQADTGLLETLNELIGRIGPLIARQLDPILHHADFQALESAWRGLHYLVTNTGTDESLKIRVLNLSRTDLVKTLARYRGAAWDSSPLFKMICVGEYGQFGGEPFGVLIGDYYFGPASEDVSTLGSIAKIAAAARVPFIAAARPALFMMSSWRELEHPRDLPRTFQTPDYSAWRALRESEDSQYIFLAVPRFLARAPHRTDGCRGDEPPFDERVDPGDDMTYLWANAAYAMAVNITKAFGIHGWCARILGALSGGAIGPLPTRESAIAGVQGSVEIPIDRSLQAELSSHGLVPLAYLEASDILVFDHAPSLHKPAKDRDHRPAATAAVAVAASLSGLADLLARSRFEHYVHCILRDKAETMRDREAVQAWFDEWITRYIDDDPAHSSAMVKAQRPLTAAHITVDEARDSPLRYTVRLQLRTQLAP